MNGDCRPCTSPDICGHPEQHEDRTLRTRSKIPGPVSSKRNSEFVESLVRAKKNIGFTAPTLEIPSGYSSNDNSPYRSNSSPLNPATIAAQALSSSFTRISELNDIESHKTLLMSKFNEITRKESTIPGGGTKYLFRIKIDHSNKISDFVKIVREIDAEFHNRIAASR